MRELAADFELHWRERASQGEERPAPYATRFAAGRLGWWTEAGRPDQKRAHRAIGRLVRAGVLVECEPLAPRGKPFGTKTYRPGGEAA
jgi:hypothetical protein